MAFFSLEHSSSGRLLSDTVFGIVFSLRARAAASYRRYSAERALEGLSYDTLKDIGFPSADMTGNDHAAR